MSATTASSTATGSSGEETVIAVIVDPIPQEAHSDLVAGLVGRLGLHIGEVHLFDAHTGATLRA